MSRFRSSQKKPRAPARDRLRWGSRMPPGLYPDNTRSSEAAVGVDVVSSFTSGLAEVSVSREPTPSLVRRITTPGPPSDLFPENNNATTSELSANSAALTSDAVTED